jgi:predicted nucleotidyltransferase
MLKLRRVDIERSEEVFEKIKAYVGEVVKHLNPYLVILFGSFATGEINEGSDVDVLVVADFKEGFLDRIATLMRLNAFGIPIEPIGYTLEELEEMKRRGNPFILEVLEKGKVLYKSKREARQPKTSGATC